MKTTKPLSTISYNSIGFLIGVLDRLVKKDILAFYAFIRHDAEEDENKDHCHLYLEPAQQVDTIWLKKQFLEPDPAHPDIPLGILPWNKSKFGDWYWYGLHDKAYLMGKGESRKYHYEPSQVLTSDPEYLAELVRRNPNPKAELLKVAELVMQGMKPMQIALALNVPMRNLEFFIAGVEMVAHHIDDVTERGSHVPHLEAYNATQDILNAPDENGEIKDEN